MSYAIVFSSRTGNHAPAGRSCPRRAACGECLYFGPPSAAALAAGRLYIGFWTDKGSCDEALAAFLPQLAGHEVFLFGTAASGRTRLTLTRSLAGWGRCCRLPPAFLGRFMCQGPHAGRRCARPYARHAGRGAPHTDARQLRHGAHPPRRSRPGRPDRRGPRAAAAGVRPARGQAGRCRGARCAALPGLAGNLPRPAARRHAAKPLAGKKRRPLCAGGLPGHAARLLRRRTAGFCGFGPWRAGPGAAEGEIIGLYVLKAYQRRGVGTALLRAALAALAGARADRVSLWVLDGNEKAVQFIREFRLRRHPARPKANRRCANAACGGKGENDRGGRLQVSRLAERFPRFVGEGHGPPANPAPPARSGGMGHPALRPPGWPPPFGLAQNIKLFVGAGFIRPRNPGAAQGPRDDASIVPYMGLQSCKGRGFPVGRVPYRRL